MKINYRHDGTLTVAYSDYSDEKNIVRGVDDSITEFVLSKLNRKDRETLLDKTPISCYSKPSEDEAFNKLLGEEIAMRKLLSKEYARQEKKLSIIQAELKKELFLIQSKKCTCLRLKEKSENMVNDYYMSEE